MTSSFPGGAGPQTGDDGHPAEELLAGYAAGTADALSAWSVEAHLTGCASCRTSLSGHADAKRLARNQSVLMVRIAVPEGGRLRRLLSGCGVPDYLVSLLAATPSLRKSWLLSVIGVLAVVTGEAAAVRYGWISAGWLAGGHSGHLDQTAMAPFLLVAPLLVLAGVAAAFLPMFDPAARLAVAAPFSGLSLLLIRAVSALLAALVPVLAAAFIVPGPGWLPAELLLPTLALSAFALAAATLMEPRAAAVTAGVLWALPGLLLAAAHTPLLIVRANAQLACAAVLCASALVVLIRRDRFEMGWTR